MNRKPYSQILDSIARDHVAENTDLAAHILVRIQKGKGATMQPRMKVFVTAVLVLLVLMIALASVPAVRAAIQRWFGYVPDVGLVSEGEIRVLAEPVSAARDGIVLTVEKVVADSEHTTVLYKVAGLTAEMVDYGKAGTNPFLTAPGCQESAVLRIPQGELSFESEDISSGQWGYEYRYVYSAIPPEIDEITFTLPCIPYTLPGKAPENWEVSLRLVPAPPDLTVFPVIEISTPVQASATAAPQSGEEINPQAISMALDRAVQMDDGYLLYITMHWESLWENHQLYMLDVYDSLRLLDANGREIQFMFDYEAMPGSEAGGQTSFAIKTAPIQVPGPITLRLDYVSVDMPAEARFTFDLGPAPVPGQEWQLNQLVDVGHGHSLRVLKATYYKSDVEGLPQQPDLTFEVKSDTGILRAGMMDTAHEIDGTGGGGGSGDGTFNSGFNYANEFPSGPITVEITYIGGIRITGHWEAQWTPPFSEQQAAATPQPDSCLNSETWQQALKKREPLPEGLAGTLAIFDALPPNYHYGMIVVNLDGSNRQMLGPGSQPSLSPDGARVVYTESTTSGPPNGLFIKDLTSGNVSLLPGTARGDDAPLWSPDGTRIAFTRGPSSGLIGAPGPYNVFAVNVDGSDLRQLTSSDSDRALAWLPDGNRILFGTKNMEGTFLRTVNVQTGEVQLLSNIISDAALSPDGTRLAFTETLPLDKYGLWVANLDGLNRSLLANGDPYVVTVPAWSPDGKWIIATVHDPDTNKAPGTTLALIQPDSCQIIALPDLYGYVTSWLP